MAENSSILWAKSRFREVPSIDTGEKRGLGYVGFSNKTAIGAARAAIGGGHHSASSEGDPMADARRMGKSELFSHFAERFEVKRTQAREYFDELTQLAEKELKRAGEFVLPGMVKLVVQKRKARMGRNPATGEAIKIPAKTVVKARIAKQLKDAVLPRK
jgi:DNA-binding protein HU-beta